MESINRKTLKIAAVQMVSQVGAIEENLKHAYRLLKVALAQEAEMVIFPELMPSGYTLAAKIWQGAEPIDGMTVDWLKKVAKEFGIFVGTSYIQARDGHFYNAFALANPDGSLAGQVLKEHAETYFFRGAKGTRHVIETSIGKIGVGICGDNHYASLIPELQREKVDLMLMPHAWPAPKEVSGTVNEEDVARNLRLAKEIASVYQQYLGVPTVFVNRVGPAALDKGPGLVSHFMNSPIYHFAGQSTIVDSDGQIVAQMDDKEGVVVAEVCLDPARKTTSPSPAYGKWLFEGALIRDVVFGLDGTAGKLWYRFNPKRRRMALEIGGR